MTSARVTRRLLLLALLSLACGREPPPGVVAVGRSAPEFQALSLEGDTVSLASLRGGPVLLNLWATWCAPCRRETPFLQSVHERFHPRGLQVVGVSMDTRAALRDVQEFVDEFGVTYRVLHDPDGRSMDLFSVIGLPASYLIDHEGTVLWSRVGEVREDDRHFEEALEQALQRAAEASRASS